MKIKKKTLGRLGVAKKAHHKNPCLYRKFASNSRDFELTCRWEALNLCTAIRENIGMTHKLSYCLEFMSKLQSDFYFSRPFAASSLGSGGGVGNLNVSGVSIRPGY